MGVGVRGTGKEGGGKEGGGKEGGRERRGGKGGEERRGEERTGGRDGRTGQGRRTAHLQEGAPPQFGAGDPAGPGPVDGVEDPLDDLRGRRQCAGCADPRASPPTEPRSRGEGRGLGLSRTRLARVGRAGAAGRALREAPPQAVESGEGLAGDAPELRGPRTGGKRARPPRKTRVPPTPGSRARQTRSQKTAASSRSSRPRTRPPRPALEPPPGLTPAPPLGTHRGDVARVELGRLLQERQPRVRVHHVLRVGRHEACGVDAGLPVRGEACGVDAG